MHRIFALLFCLLPLTAITAENQILAVVGSDIITSYDVQQHVKLALVSSGIKDTPSARQKLAERSLNGLIAETLQRQEAARLGLKASPAELQNALAGIEQQNKMPAGTLKTLLQEAGIPFTALERQVESSILWAKAVQRRYGARVNVSDAEVSRTYDALKGRSGQPEYGIAEIFLPFANQTEEKTVRTSAEHLVEQLKRGANFPELARQFSQSASSAAGGDRGFLALDDLPLPLRAAVQQMQTGQLSPALRTDEGYYILYLRGKRDAGRTAPTASDNASAELYQLVFPSITGGIDARAADEATRRKATATLKGCPAARAFATANGLSSSGDLGALKLRDMPAPLRNAVMVTPAGYPMPPAWLQNRHVVFMVCSTSGITAGKAAPLPSKDAVRDRLRSQALERLAGQYLAQIKRGTLIELKK